MKENESKKSFVRVTEGNAEDPSDVLQDGMEDKKKKLKKPLIFGLMGVAFVGSMYLLFKPSEDKKKIENIGLNEAVPQATESKLPDDKGKAYEQELLERKEQEKRNAMASLSDYLNTENKEKVSDTLMKNNQQPTINTASGQVNPALNSYQNMQSTLGSFYQNDNSETAQLHKQLDELKEKLSEKDAPKSLTMDDQLALMEKSYKMAAKYLPAGTGEAIPVGGAAGSSSSQKQNFVAFTPARKNAVSALYREPSDSTFLAEWNGLRNRAFYTDGAAQKIVQPRNSVKACVQEAQTVVGETTVKLRLLEDAQTPERAIPKGTVLTANANYQGGRLQLKVSSIELEGNISPVDITIYDLDGQPGLYVPYSPELNAVTEMAGNMGQQSGTSLMLTQSAKQQIAADLSRGLIQGISGYFSKKVKTPKVTLKAGYQVFLVSKK